MISEFLYVKGAVVTIFLPREAVFLFDIFVWYFESFIRNSEILKECYSQE